MGRSKKTYNREKRYLVEDILNRKSEDGKILYLVKWEGYSGNKCTWEPSENLNDSLIKRYERSISEGIPFILLSSDESSEDEEENDDIMMKEILEIKVKNRIEQCKILYDDGTKKWVPKNKIQNEKILQEYEDKKDRYCVGLRKRLSKESIVNDNVFLKKKNSSIESLEEKTTETEKNTCRTRSFKQPLLCNYDSKYSLLKNNRNPPRRSSRLNTTYNFKETSPLSSPRSSGSSCTWTNDTVNTFESTSSQNKTNKKASKIDVNDEYRIRWKGYTSKHDTWQTADTFYDSNIITEYEKATNKEKYKSAFTSTFNNNLNEDINDCLLDTIMSDAKKGTKYNEKEILGVLAMQYNKKNEKFYLIQLINKSVVPIHSTDIPEKFKSECLRLDRRQSFGW
uniref:Chromo domain-containing protein n=1 Tax=Strongyloides venezuelensis TaxID=75913 RepID=A0A0K0F2X4_STRVS